MRLQTLAINLKEPSPFYKGVLGGGAAFLPLKVYLHRQNLRVNGPGIMVFT